MEKILIIDFGSQYTHLIAKQVRQLEIYSEVVPYTKIPDDLSLIRGIILSGSPHSVTGEKYPTVNLELFKNLPILGICYGCQVIAREFGKNISSSTNREFGEHTIKLEKDLLGISKEKFNVWMSHNDTVSFDNNIEVIARTTNDVIAAFKVKDKNIFGLQFHPEVSHTAYGSEMISNFIKLCNITDKYIMKNYKDVLIEDIKDQIKNEKVIMAISGGVDSTVVAGLLSKAISSRLTCIFVDNGLLRKNEVEEVKNYLENFGLQLRIIDASKEFLLELKKITDPEQKRKIIGNTFIKVFQKFSKKLNGGSSCHRSYKWLGQGTIYPDVIESVPGFGLIKSHHNVGGLPKNMELKLIEPIRTLFKDEVRELGKEIGIPSEILKRHPFPGPGLAIRILGEVTLEKINMVRESDHIFISELKDNDLYDKIWQAGAILLPVKSVGVMGDCRTYEYTIALRAICSENGMTAKPFNFDCDFLNQLSTKIINSVKGVNRVVYDISSKPPSTIEWE